MFPSRGRPAALFLLLALLLAPVAVPLPAAAQALPGMPPKGAEAAETEIGTWQKLRFEITRLQQKLQRDLAGLARELKTSDSLAPLATLLLFSFLYGVVHAVGPGHGKVVISSYLLAQESRVKRGIHLAFLAALVQAFSAIALVGVLALLLDLTSRQAAAKVQLLEIASYGLIIALGLWMLVAALRGRIGCGHDHHHGHDGAEPAATNPAAAPKRGGFTSFTAMVLSVGIRPCSGAVIILLFTLAQGIFLAGIGATFAMALGTAITVSLLGILAVTSRRLAIRIAGHDSVWEDRIGRGLAIVGSLAICLFGAFFLFLAVNQPVMI